MSLYPGIQPGSFRKKRRDAIANTYWFTIERDMAKPATYGELILCLKSSLHSTYDLLKRPDEAELVLLAHNALQFVEDSARKTAKEVGYKVWGLSFRVRFC